ncbi:MAG: AAA family ATPase [Nitrospira sp.]|nr:AAA family ATPase [Nitrospira sp.]
MKLGLDDWLVKQSGDLKEAFAYLDRIPLGHSTLVKASAWHQKWKKEEAARQADQGVLIYRRADSIKSRPTRWLIPGRFALGKTGMIAGHPGFGKSQAAISITATVSTGGTFSTADAPCEIGTTIILSAEDGAEDTLRPRLEAAGADLSRVFIIDAVADRSSVDGPRVFDLKRDLGKLGDMIRVIGGASLIVIDPISAYLGGTDSHKNAEVRSLLTPLASFAEEHGVAVVCISHFNKNMQTEAIMRITGSLAFVAAARSAYVVVQDPENEARRLFLPLKNNLGPDRTGLAFTVEPVQLDSDEGPIQTSRILWEAGVVTTTAKEAMAPPLNSGEQTELESAKGFLRALLADGPVSSKQIRADVMGAGHSWGTIRRAQEALKVIAFKQGLGGWAWRLPTEDAQASPKMLVNNGCASSTSSGGNEHLQVSQVPVKAEDVQGPLKMLTLIDEKLNGILQKQPVPAEAAEPLEPEVIADEA